MPSPFKKSQNNKENINQSLRNTIYQKVTKKTHHHESPKKSGDGTLKKCIKFFNQGADPNVLSELEEFLRKHIESEKVPEQKEEYQKHYKYYTQYFLPALKTEVTESEELAIPSVFNKKIEQPQRPQTIRGEIVGIILGITNRSSNKILKTEEHPINSVKKEEIPVSSTEMTEDNVESLMTPDQTQLELESLTKEKVCASGSDSGVNSREPSEESLASSIINSRRSSVSSILSAAEEDNGLQPEGGEKTELLESNSESPKENANQVQLEQAVKEEPKMQENGNPGGQVDPGQVEKESLQVSSQCLTLGSREKESLMPVSATRMTDGQVKDLTQSKEEKNKENATVQKPSANRNNDKDILLKNQPNNRNLYGAFTAGCALLAVGCVAVAAIKESQILHFLGAVLFVAAAASAILTAVTWYLTPSSELTSTNLSRPVDDKELTACSHL